MKESHKKILFLLIWAGMMAVLTGYWRLLIPQSEEYAIITHPEYNFSVEYPTKWVADTYGEHGYKGADHKKLLIYRTLLNSFFITVYYQPATNPTLQDVVNWGDDITPRSHNRATSDTYKEYGLQEDNIDEHPILRSRFRSELMMYENVYIAYPDSMVIIKLQAEQNEFDQYVTDFNDIVASFRFLK